MKKQILFNKKFYKVEVKKLVSWFVVNHGSIRTNKFVDKLKLLGFLYATQFGTSLGLSDLLSPRLRDEVLRNTQREIDNQYFKTVNGKISEIDFSANKNDLWNKSNNFIVSEIVKNFEQTDLLNSVYVMIKSGARGNLSQIKQLVGIRGLVSDSQGEIISVPIKKNLKEGIDLAEYFISCYGARKGVIDTALKTANSGYLTRKLVYVSQNQVIKKPDCATSYGLCIKFLKKDKNDFDRLKKSVLGRVLAKSLIIKVMNRDIYLSAGQDICAYLLTKLFFVDKLFIRSPLTCLINIGICQLCYGWNLGNGRMVELGEAVGILAAQSIGEPGTQLTMRTFHTGGMVNVKTNQAILSPVSGRLIYNSHSNGFYIQTELGDRAFFTRKDLNVWILPFTGNRLTINIPRFSLIYIKNMEKVNFKQVVSEKLNFNSYYFSSGNKFNSLHTIKNSISGLALEKLVGKKKRLYAMIVIGNIMNFKNITDCIQRTYIRRIKLFTNYEKTVKSLNLNALSISNVNRRKFFNILEILKGENLNFPLNFNFYLVTKKEKINKLFLINKNGGKINISSQSNLHLGDFRVCKSVSKRKFLASSQINERKLGKIVLVKANVYGLQKSGKRYFVNRQLVKKYYPFFDLKFKKSKVNDIVEGLPKIQRIFEVYKKHNLNYKLKEKLMELKKKYKYKIAIRKSIRLIQAYLLKKVQSVYVNQGISINDKHFEVIIKQMTSKVVVRKEGDSKLLNGEVVSLAKVEKINKNINEKAIYDPIIIGISKFIQLDEGFLASSCFQETVGVVTRSAVEGKIDWLYGLKENIVLGNLIPIGTGLTIK